MKDISLRFFAFLVIAVAICASSDARVLAQELPKIPYDATAVTLDGETVSLKDYRGKLVFLTVWRTDCKACMLEIPVLNKLQQEYAGEDFTVVGLSMDRDNDDLVREVIEVRDIAYPIWLGYDQPLSKYTQTQYLPTLFAIGPDGRVLGFLIGAFQSYEEAVTALKQARGLIKGKQGVE